MKSRELVTCNGKASFYASIYDDLRQIAMDCGWALALHGSLANDMDIMAMPWTEEAKPVEEMIKALSNCFDGNPFQHEHIKPHYDKPHNRVVYTMSIWADYYLDISIIQPTIEAEPVRHGYNDNQNYHEVDEFRCSECGLHLEDWNRHIYDEDAEDEYIQEYSFKYCPECGTKMDGKK